jgi:Zn-dependent protease with chaperone function
MENGARGDVMGELSTEAEVEALVRVTALREGFTPPEVRWSDAATSKARFGGRVIELRRTILRDSDEARFVALHELGHVAEQHQQTARSSFKLAGLVVAATPFFIGPWLAWETGAALAEGLVFGLLVTLVLWALAARWLFHPHEYAADRWAAERGGILTEQIARTAYGSFPAWVEHVTALLLSHPPMSRRVRRVQEVLSQVSRADA